jgi:hypothetical protein
LVKDLKEEQKTVSTMEIVREAGSLRLLLQMNNRLRLESLAALSKVFRENGVPVTDSLLRTVVLAVPDELLGEGEYAAVSKQGGKKRPRKPSKQQPPVPIKDTPSKRQPPNGKKQQKPSKRQPPIPPSAPGKSSKKGGQKGSKGGGKK